MCLDRRKNPRFRVECAVNIYEVSKEINKTPFRHKGKIKFGEKVHVDNPA